MPVTHPVGTTMRELPTTILGVMHVELHIPMCQSLKQKRSALKPCLNHLRTRFNIAVAEVAEHDVWARPSWPSPPCRTNAPAWKTACARSRNIF